MSMAKFAVDGLDDIIRQLEESDIYSDEAAQDILFELADEMTEAAKTEMQKSPFDLGRIAGRVGYTKRVKTDSKGVKSVTVTVKGKNARGESNATVAFVLNYGRSEKYGAIPGGYFWTRANKHVQTQALDIAEKKAEQYYKSKGLI